MGRTPMDTIPQRVLVHDLKRAIDLMPRDPNAVKRVRRLVSENPRSSRSSHVLKNLGRDRVTTLSRVIDEPLRGVTRAGASFPRAELADGDSSSLPKE